jgi:hypothetical protein
MNSLTDVVKCTVDDGGLWMHLDDMRVNIASSLAEKSPMLKAVMSSRAEASSTRDITLAAPKEWLRSWASCFGSGETRLSGADITDLVNCLLVCFCYENAAFL